MQQDEWGPVEFLAVCLLAPMLIVPVLGMVGDAGQRVLGKLADLGVLTDTPVLALPGTTLGPTWPVLLVFAGIVLGLVLMSGAARGRRRVREQRAGY